MSSSRVLVLQHGELGPPGVLGEWLADRGLQADVRHVWEDGAPAALDGHVAVASLGSQYSPANAEPQWIHDEIALLRRAAEAGTPVLGLCFGGQALAVALGGGIGPAPVPEVGWSAVETADPGVVAPGPWLQFHWEAFTPPPGAEVLARSGGGVAAFRVGPHLGTQFHPEITPEIVDGWAAVEERLEAVGTSRDALLAEGRERMPDSRANAYRLFDAWWSGAAASR